MQGDDGDIEAIGESSDEGEAVKEINSFINTATKPARPSKADTNLSRIQQMASGGVSFESDLWQPNEEDPQM